MNSERIVIHGTDFWIKPVDEWQRNWALIEKGQGDAAVIYFINDNGGLFDKLDFAAHDEAVAGLRRNGFLRFADEPRLNKAIAAPELPLHHAEHPYGKVYSEGKFWK